MDLSFQPPPPPPHTLMVMGNDKRRNGLTHVRKYFKQSENSSLPLRAWGVDFGFFSLKLFCDHQFNFDHSTLNETSALSKNYLGEKNFDSIVFIRDRFFRLKSIFFSRGHFPVTTLSILFIKLFTRKTLFWLINPDNFANFGKKMLKNLKLNISTQNYSFLGDEL